MQRRTSTPALITCSLTRRVSPSGKRVDLRDVPRGLHPRPSYASYPQQNFLRERLRLGPGTVPTSLPIATVDRRSGTLPTDVPGGFVPESCPRAGLRPKLMPGIDDPRHQSPVLAERARRTVTQTAIRRRTPCRSRRLLTTVHGLRQGGPMPVVQCEPGWLWYYLLPVAVRRLSCRRCRKPSSAQWWPEPSSSSLRFG